MYVIVTGNPSVGFGYYFDGGGFPFPSPGSAMRAVRHYGLAEYSIVEVTPVTEFDPDAPCIFARNLE